MLFSSCEQMIDNRIVELPFRRLKLLPAYRRKHRVDVKFLNRLPVLIQVGNRSSRGVVKLSSSNKEGLTADHDFCICTISSQEWQFFLCKGTLRAQGQDSQNQEERQDSKL